MMPNTLEVAREHLFSSVEEMDKAGLPELIKNRLLRLRDMYTYWLQWPETKDAKIVAELRKRYHVGQNIAYRDLRIVKHLLGELNKASKDYARYKFTCMVEKAFDLAERRNDAKAMAAAAAAYARYNKLDKEDPEDLGFDKIAPQSFEMTDDPTVAGFKRIPNVREKIRKMIDELGTAEIEEVKFEEVEFDEDKIFTPKVKLQKTAKPYEFDEEEII